MKLDYSPVERPPRPTRKVLLAAAICIVGLATLVTRETTATRQAMDASLVSEAELAEAMAFDRELQTAVSDTVSVPTPSEWIAIEVKAGDSLSSLFDNQGLRPEYWMSILGLGEETKPLRYVKAGETLELLKRDGQLEELRYQLDDLTTLHVHRSGDGFEANTVTAEVERNTRVLSGIITSSLFEAGQEAGLSVRAVMNLAQLFRYDIDFALDLRQGDRFSVVIEELYKDGKKLRDGDLLAAEFVNQGKVHQAVRFMDSKGRVAYYTPKGESLRKAFFRTPLDVARISSHFNLNRRHPILNTIRAHKGVDYAAGRGTPIKATGKGHVAFIGTKGGYGRTIVLKHGTQYETLYAHMSRYAKGLKTGSRVRQGQVIGYVGTSGLSTAPHLHYEFRVNGVHKNPIKIVMPRANPIPRSQMTAFRMQIAPLLAQIESVGAPAVAMDSTGLLPAISAAN